MSTLTSRPMSLLGVEFDELYARHLCRHSQFGINVAHLAALFGTWFGVYGAVYWLFRTEWLPVAHGSGLPGRARAQRADPRTMAASRHSFSVALMVAASARCRCCRVWAYLADDPWSATSFSRLEPQVVKANVEHDMTEFNPEVHERIRPVRRTGLLFYEVPIVLNFLLFGQKRWGPRAGAPGARGRRGAAGGPGGAPRRTGDAVTRIWIITTKAG